MAWGVFHTWPRIIQAQVVSTRKRLVQNGAGNHNSGFSPVPVLVKEIKETHEKALLQILSKPRPQAQKPSQHLQLNIDCTELANCSSFVKGLRRSTKQNCVYGSGATSFSEVAQDCLLYHTWQTLFPEFSILKKKQPYTTIFLSSPYKKRTTTNPCFPKTPHWPKSSWPRILWFVPRRTASAAAGPTLELALTLAPSVVGGPSCCDRLSRCEAGQGHPNLFLLRSWYFTRGDVKIMSNWFLEMDLLFVWCLGNAGAVLVKDVFSHFRSVKTSGSPNSMMERQNKNHKNCWMSENYATSVLTANAKL